MARTPSTPKRATAPRKLRTPVAAAALQRRRQFLAASFSNEILIEMGKTLNAFLQGFFSGDADFQVDIPAPQDAAAVKQLVDDVVGVDARIEPERSPLTLSRLADRADMEIEARVRGVFFGRNDTDDSLQELLLQAKVITGDDEKGENDMQDRVRMLEQQLSQVRQQQVQVQMPNDLTNVLKRVLEKQANSDDEESRAKKLKSAGVLGLRERWKTSGDNRFIRWVEAHMKKYRTQVEGTGKWVQKLQAAQEAESQAEQSLHDYQDEYDDAEGDSKTCARVRLDEAFRLWIAALEELRVIHKCWKEQDPRQAEHLHEIYMEKRYGTKEDTAMSDLVKEAEKRTERDWTVETNHFLQESRVREAKQSICDRLGRESKVQPPRRGQAGQEQANGGRHQARLAEEVFRQCPAEIQGLYVTVGGAYLYDEPKLEWAAQAGHRRGEGIPWHVYPKPVCFFCKGDDHSSWECEEQSYTNAEGKQVIPPLRLHRLGLVCGRGRVYSDILRRD